MEEIERIAKHHFPENEIYREGNKLFIKSNKLMDSRRYEFRANSEITTDGDKLCFKTKINKTTFLFYLFGILVIIGLMVLRFYDVYRMMFSVGIPMYAFLLSDGMLFSFLCR